MVFVLAVGVGTTAGSPAPVGVDVSIHTDGEFETAGANVTVDVHGYGDEIQLEGDVVVSGEQRDAVVSEGLYSTGESSSSEGDVLLELANAEPRSSEKQIKVDVETDADAVGEQDTKLYVFVNLPYRYTGENLELNVTAPNLDPAWQRDTARIHAGVQYVDDVEHDVVLGGQELGPHQEGVKSNLAPEDDPDAFALSGFSIQTSNVGGQDCGGVDYGGDGTSDAPYEVDSAVKLQCISAEPNAYYELTDSIDASETASWDDGEGFEPIGPSFSGTLDGAGHSIKNIHTDRSDDVGVFEEINDGTLKDVTYSLNVTSDTVNTIAGVAVEPERGTTIENVDYILDITEVEEVGDLGGVSGFEVHGSVSVQDVDFRVKANDLSAGDIGGISPRKNRRPRTDT